MGHTAASDWDADFDASLAAVFSPYYGYRRFVPDRPSPEPDPLSDLSGRFAQVIRNNRWLRVANRQSVTIDFQVIRDDSIGAFAFPHDAKNYIVFHHLFFSGLLDIFCRLTDQLELDLHFDDVPIPAARRPLTGDPRRPSQVQDGRASPTHYGLPTYYPRSQGRLALAVHLQTLALEFLFLHELHHIICGHLGDAAYRRGVQAIAECGAPSSPDVTENRAIEYVADLFAAQTLAESCLRNQFILLKPQQFTAAEGQGETLLYLLNLSVTTLFCVIQSFIEAGDQENRGDYPAVLTRYVTVIDNVTRRLDGADHPLASRWPYIVEKARKDLKAALVATGYADRLVREIAADPELDNAFRETTRLAERALEFQPNWNRHAITTTDAP